MQGYPSEVAAARAGVSIEVIERFTELGLMRGNAETGYSDSDVRRVQVVRAMERSEMPVEQTALLVRSGAMSLDFMDSAAYHVFSALSDTTFGELSERTGVPLEVLLLLRDATVGRRATAEDRVREDELRILPFVQLAHALGFQARSIERPLRVYRDGLRRIAEAEAEWWRSEIVEPLLDQGASAEELGRRSGERGAQFSEVIDEALLAVYHAQQMQVWTDTLVAGLATALEQAGLHQRQERSPAMSFLDLSGFTQLTQERGDAAAAELAARLNTIVQSIAVRHGGRAVKWLGDGVMCYFPEPGDGVRASLEMVREVPAAGLPPAHVGLHAGPVVLQDGDYYGQTVNLAARIGEYARPGEVLVSRAVVEASDGAASFTPIGPVGLKGLSGVIELFAARPADRRAADRRLADQPADT